MKFAFVTNDKYYSKLYCWLAKEKASHMGVIIGDVVYDGNKPCGKRWTLKAWLKKYRLVTTVDIDLNKYSEWKASLIADQKIKGVTYDMDGYYYGMFRLILRRIFRIPLPHKNKWHTSDKLMCTEIPFVFRRFLLGYGINVWMYDFSAHTVGQIEKFLRKKTEGNHKVMWTDHED